MQLRAAKIGHETSPCERVYNNVSLAEVVHMKRILIISSAIAVTSLACAAVVSGQTVSNRPQGVSAKQWIPVSDKMGFVVLPAVPIASGSADPDVLMVKPPVEGYFMVKDGTGWSRIAITEPVFGPGGT
jgi:hypothetical protein